MGWREAHVIHALRIECGWQVKELAKRAGLGTSVIYRLEDGRVLNPTPQTLAKLATAFGVTVKEIRNAVPSEPIKVAMPLPIKAKRAQPAPPKPHQKQAVPAKKRA